MRAKSLVAIVFSVMLVIGLATPAGAGGGGGGLCGAVSEGGSLAIRDFCFDGAAHLTDPEATVHIVNYGETTHDVTAADGSFASGPLEPGETFNVKLGSRGVVRYYCTLHGSADGGGMAGVLVSEGAAEATEVASAPLATDGASLVSAESTAADPAPASPASLDAALVAATNAAQSDATVALVVVTIIGMAVAFGLGLMVWAVGRLPATRRDPE